MNISELEQYCEKQWFYDVRNQLRDHIYKRTEQAINDGDAARDAILDRSGLDRRKALIHDRFIDSLGGLPPSHTPLNPHVVGTIRCDGYRIEKIIFESRPQAYITSNLYIPDGITRPTGAVIFVSGHYGEARMHSEYQSVCQILVRAGLVVLAQDPIGQGERNSYYEQSIQGMTIPASCPEHDYAGAQCWPTGGSSARYFVHDIIRGVDYLAERNEVDPLRIGITGNSGGGTQTALAMLCETRIAAAAPATFITNRKSFMLCGMAQDTEQIWPGTTEWGFDHEDILISMVPKPVLVIAAKWDYFPIEGTRRTVKRCRRFWDMYEKSENFELFEDDTPHMYTIAMAHKAAVFFAHHLLGKELSHESTPISVIDPSHLYCTSNGQVRNDLPQANFVFEENLALMFDLKQARKKQAINEKNASAQVWLREKVHNKRAKCALNTRQLSIWPVHEHIVTHLMWWSQEGVLNSAFVFVNHRFVRQKLKTILAVWDGGTGCLQSHMNVIRANCRSGKAVVVLDVSGSGSITPNPFNFQPLKENYGALYKLSHELIWLGDSLAALRTYDVIRAIDAMQEFNILDTDDLTVYAYGRQGIYGKLAFYIDERIKRIIVKEGMRSCEDWVGSRYYEDHEIYSVIIPDMLKHFDFPEIDLQRKYK